MKPFSEQEKKQILAKLMQAGKKLFPEYGLKKTTISQIANFTQIPKSTFYQFFKSKFDLYKSIVEEYSKDFYKLVVHKTLSEKNPKKGITSFIKRVIKTIEENELLKLLLEKENESYYLAKMSDEDMELKTKSSLDMICGYVEQWQKQGQLIHEDPYIIAGVIRSVIFLEYHKKEIGKKDFDKIIDLISSFVANGLTKQKEY